MKKLTTRTLRHFKQVKSGRSLNMLTCYDFQTAQLLAETDLDLILVGDSVGNVILGHDSTVSVSLEEMIIFGGAVKRGAPEKFTVVDLPFGACALFDDGVRNAIKLFQSTGAEALKLEGASELNCKIIRTLADNGIPVMGHIGLQPQSVHQQGGYFTHGKSEGEKERLIEEAKKLEEAGCFAIVLECVRPEVAADVTHCLSIPTIGIGSGTDTDGQVLVINDLLKLGSGYLPTFVNPVANLYETKKELIEKYLDENRGNQLGLNL